jgi:glycosyltransferase involved in cell wall biosynthesis
VNVLALNWRDPGHPEAGGAEVHLFEILRRWVARGTRVTYLASGFDGGAPEAERDGVRILRRGTWWNGNWAAMRAVRGELKREAFDLVVEDLNKLPYFSPLFTRVPVLVVVPHLFGTTVFAEASLPIATAVWAHERLVPFVYRDCPFLAISESTRDDLVARGLAGHRIAVSHCGLDHSTFRPGGAKTAEPSVLFVGRLRRYKGVDVLLYAFRRLRERLPAARLTILGDGPHRATLEALAGSLGLGESVRFTGFVPSREKVRAMQSAWVSAFPSPKEGWGLTVIESNACGTPVVASRSPGLVDSVRDHVSGLLVAHGDAAALAGTLERVLTDEPLRARLGAGGVEWASRFTWERAAGEAWAVAEAAARRGPLPDLSLRREESPPDSLEDRATAHPRTA